MREVEILSRLVACRSVMLRSNRDVVGYIKQMAGAEQVSCVEVCGPDQDRSNLWITVGPKDRPGYVLSGHLDVVPADESGWRSDPFQLMENGEVLTARGSSDMLGFVACALAAIPVARDRGLSSPLHIALSYDEEAGCLGVPHLLREIPRLCAPPIGAIIGEPSNMAPIFAHKGKAAVTIKVTGRAGHSSRPDLALNAIHALSDILAACSMTAADLVSMATNESFLPPYSTLVAGKVSGGVSVNVIAATASMEFEVRALPGFDPVHLMEPIVARLEPLRRQGFTVEWHEQCNYPGLSLSPDSALAALMAAINPNTPIAGVSYGTEGGLFQAAGIPSIICGPGDIDRAHKANEFILKQELRDCSSLISALIERLV